MDGVDGTLYEGEQFQLLFKFNNKYPFDSPEVIRNTISFIYLKKMFTNLLYLYLGYIYRPKYSYSSACLFKWSYLFIHFNGRLVRSFLFFKYIFMKFY